MSTTPGPANPSTTSSQTSAPSATSNSQASPTQSPHPTALESARSSPAKQQSKNLDSFPLPQQSDAPPTPNSHAPHRLRSSPSGYVPLAATTASSSHTPAHSAPLPLETIRYPRSLPSPAPAIRPSQSRAPSKSLGFGHAHRASPRSAPFRSPTPLRTEPPQPLPATPARKQVPPLTPAARRGPTEISRPPAPNQNKNRALPHWECVPSLYLPRVRPREPRTQPGSASKTPASWTSQPPKSSRIRNSNPAAPRDR